MGESIWTFKNFPIRNNTILVYTNIYTYFLFSFIYSMINFSTISFIDFPSITEMILRSSLTSLSILKDKCTFSVITYPLLVNRYYYLCAKPIYIIVFCSLLVYCFNSILG